MAEARPCQSNSFRRLHPPNRQDPETALADSAIKEITAQVVVPGNSASRVEATLQRGFC